MARLRVAVRNNNGQANAAADAGQVAPDARENVAPNNVDNNGVNTGSGGTIGARTTESQVH
ncbi:protein YbgS, partial [Escherichia sp. TWPC-MK]